MKILVCDDRKDGASEVLASMEPLQSITEVAKIEVWHSDQLREQLNLFFNGIENTKGEQHNSSQFDGWDIVLLDNNLSALGITGARLTAEAIAGYIRAFSTATYIVSLNKNPDVDFDLRYLIGDYTTAADIALNYNHLANKALWTGRTNDSTNGFKPWYWPALLLEPIRRKKQISFVKKHLNKPVFEALGFPSSIENYMSRHAVGSISPSADYPTPSLSSTSSNQPVNNVTFSDFFAYRNRSLPNLDDRNLVKSNLEIVSRAVAADVDLWIRRDLLGPQDALVDLPHLLLRMPHLLGKRAANLISWNHSLTRTRAPFNLDGDLCNAILSPALMKAFEWTRTPTFFWSTLLDMPYQPGSKKVEIADVVFCEDTSSFVQRNPSDERLPSPFIAEFEGTWARRYVRKIEGVGYSPKSRLAL